MQIQQQRLVSEGRRYLRVRSIVPSSTAATHVALLPPAVHPCGASRVSGVAGPNYRARGVTANEEIDTDCATASSHATDIATSREPRCAKRKQSLGAAPISLSAVLPRGKLQI